MKIFKKALIMSTFASAMLSINAFAYVANISVNFSETKQDPGVVYEAEPKVSGGVDLVDWSCSSDYDEWKAGRKVTFTLSVEAKNGYTIGKTKSNISVSGSNAELASKSLTSSKATLKVNYWPTMQLADPTNIYFEDDYLATWDKVEGCSKYEVKIHKDDGENEKTETVSVTKNEIDLGSYTTDGSDVTFEVRAVAKDNTQSKYLKNSNWVSVDDTVTTSSNNSAYGSFSGSGNNITFRTTENKNASGWQLINGSWYYFNPQNGNKAISDAWALINDRWYHFNNYGIMQTGWLLVNGAWFYLNPTNGTGEMLTGWIQTGPSGPWYYLDPANGAMVIGWRLINDKWYYFDTASGVMYHDTTTPDGYRVGSDGACL